ncbi:hypothetical protein Q5M85_11100 [Paraclostridium bifermentans]|nr:hypothetical protein [Paraclostridium bifermentans]
MVFKKYKEILSIFMALSIVLVISIRGIQLNIDLSKSIENDIPLKSNLFNSKSESQTDTPSIDNKIINRRYKVLNKNVLTYKLARKNVKENYFFEFENEFAQKFILS